MSQQAFFFDGTRCSGCKTCMFACKDAYDLDVGTAYRRVLEYTGGDTVRNGDGTFGSTCFSYNVSVACNHCDHAQRRADRAGQRQRPALHRLRILSSVVPV